MNSEPERGFDGYFSKKNKGLYHNKDYSNWMLFLGAYLILLLLLGIKISIVINIYLHKG